MSKSTKSSTATTAISYWTAARVERLCLWHKRGLGYDAIASHFKGKSTNSIYKKLGRMGMVSANWSKKTR